MLFDGIFHIAVGENWFGGEWLFGIVDLRLFKAPRRSSGQSSLHNKISASLGLPSLDQPFRNIGECKDLRNAADTYTHPHRLAYWLPLTVSASVSAKYRILLGLSRLIYA